MSDPETTNFAAALNGEWKARLVFSGADGAPIAVRQLPTLTDEVIADLWHANGGFHHHFARAVERWLKGEK